MGQEIRSAGTHPGDDLIHGDSALEEPSLADA
jgi:hypothetical protein